MKRSNRLVLLVGIFLAVVAFVGIYLLFSGNGPNPGPGATASPPTTAKVVVAKVDIPLGTQVTADMIDLKEVAIADSISSFTNPGLVISKTIRKTAFAGTQLTFDYFIDTGTANDVTSNLPAGTRGIAVQVDQVSGVGTLVHTGDWVDVVVSVKIQQVAPNPSAKSVTNVGTPQGSVKLIIQHVQVVGTLLPPPTAAPAAASQAPQPSGQPTTTLNGQQEIVILAVSNPNHAEVIRYAELYADPISLVLRSPKDFVSQVAPAVSPSPGVSPGPSPSVLPGGASIPPDVRTDGAILRVLIEKYGVLSPDLLAR